MNSYSWDNDFSWLFHDYKRSEEYLIIRAEQNSESPTQLHFSFNQLIKLYYKFRNEKPDAVYKCITVCKKDIELFPFFIAAWKIEHPSYPFIPHIPSFKQLALIYEKLEQYDDAIEICELALKYGLDDGTKSNYEGRLRKIKKLKEAKTLKLNAPLD